MRRAHPTILILLLALLLPSLAFAQWAPVQPSSGGSSGATAVWTTGACTRIDNASFSVVDNAANVAIYRPGVPMRYGDVVGTWYRGLITTVVDAGATLTVTITGAPMDVGHDGNCQYGQTSLIERDLLTIPGQYADGVDAALMLHDLLFLVPPSKTSTRYLVSACARPITDDTGAAQSALTVYVNGTAASTALTLSDAAWTCTSPATIDPAAYDLQTGETWEIGTDAAGTNDDAVNLTVQLVWLLEA